ncbi:MAG: 2-oxoacid:acceptor oxidoreductase family protein [Candidatus Omnitrophica bacterium]|jgi:2-oxoglutarate ferredoxin oxidoreductase subunit gamma|nr:2-oxoacid:acceptor oxidoreductase family protein [Candidatus Omnitrophota bacterium]
MKKNYVWKIIAGGSGGQGIITLGKSLAYAGIYKNLNVSFLPTYGAEMRGGYVFCMIILSTSKLSSPVISNADFGVFMDTYSFQLLYSKLNSSALCLWNSSIFTNFSAKKFLNLGIPATEIAEKKSSIKTANMVMLGAIGKIINNINNSLGIDKKSLIFGIKHVIKDKEHIKENIDSMSEGWNIAGKNIKAIESHDIINPTDS